jgi:hypothetical protein
MPHVDYVDPNEAGERTRERGYDDAGIVRLLAVATAAVAANTIADALGVHPTERPDPFATGE